MHFGQIRDHWLNEAMRRGGEQQAGAPRIFKLTARAGMQKSHSEQQKTIIPIETPSVEP